MSSRDTFITSFIYYDNAKDAIKAVLEDYAFTLHDHGNYFSGMIKGAYCNGDIWEDCDKALRAIGYTPHFDIAIVLDDQQHVIQRDDPHGSAAYWEQIKERNQGYVDSVRAKERAKTKQEIHARLKCAAFWNNGMMDRETVLRTVARF